MTETSTTPAPWQDTFMGPAVILPVSVKGKRIGDVKAVFTDAGHAHVTASPFDHLGGRILYREASWDVRVDVWAESAWTEDRPAGRTSSQSDFKGYTTGQATAWEGDAKIAAPTYRAAIVTAITEAVSAFVAQHPEVLTAAQRNRLETDLGRASRDRDEARNVLADAEAEVSRIEQAIAALGK